MSGGTLLRQGRLAVGLQLAATALLLAFLIMGFTRGDVSGLPTSDRTQFGLQDAFWWSGWWALGVVGTVIVLRRPGNRVGWVLTAVGALVCTEGFVQELTVALLAGAPRSALGGLAAWVLSWVYFPPFALLPFIFLLFPDGRLPGPGWRWLGFTVVAAAAVGGTATAIGTWAHRGPALLANEPPGTPSITNGAVNVLTAGLVVAATASLVARYRRADATVRRQIVWLVYAGALVVVAIVASYVGVGQEGVVAVVLNGLLVFVIPLAIGIAVLRYRLYEIDRIISRTVTYAVVTALLLALYAVVAVLPSTLFDLESDLLVAAATLAAAAAFGPARRRVQAVVDRRFNRSRYDAARVVERFGARLRDEVDAAVLAADVRRVVAVTVQPDRVSLWLRSSETT